MNEIDLLYNNIDKYFKEKFSHEFGSLLVEKVDSLLRKSLDQMLAFLARELTSIGFDKQAIEEKFVDEFFSFRTSEIMKINTAMDLYENKIAPIIYEIFLEQFVKYLADPEPSDVILKIKEKGFLPLEFMVELRKLKLLFQNDPDKTENLNKYLKIKKSIISKFQLNKNNIESLEDLENTRDKLQLLYLIYRIIEFFRMQKSFDFSHIKEYIEKNVDEWLDTVPLITLKNPDLYFCGIFLANHLQILLKKEDKDKIKDFLTTLYEETLDEFEAPLMEATRRLYYFLKSSEMTKLWLQNEDFYKIIQIDPKFFESEYLRTLETSQLVVVIKIINILGISPKFSQNEINAISEEISQRISKEGIKQLRDGFVTSEATYYVLFCNFMKDSLEDLKEYSLVDNVVSRIYRNLEMINFDEDMNFDLVSELFYSCESLKLLNCIETKEMINHLVKYLFPNEVSEKINQKEEIGRSGAKFRHLRVNRITGETIY